MLKNIYYRLYQQVIRFAEYFLGIKSPKTISGAGSMLKSLEVLEKKKLHSPLVVTDNGLHNIGLIKPLISKLDESNMHYAYFHDVVANPTIKNVEDGLKVYKENKCDSIIVIGGGSAIDCAKLIGARVARPKRTVEKMKGLLKVGRKLPFLIAIPTTAGTGSETTLAAVIVNEVDHHKYAVNDPHLIPKLAILDPTLLTGLPSYITSTTGMDALTHAVEAFIGHSNTKHTKKAAIEAVKLINENLLKSFEDGKNLLYRENMQKASFLAGVAFTRAYVGYVHAIAHSLGGQYNVAHGLANAIILPYILEEFGKKCYKRLAILSDEISLCEKSASVEQKAKAFISWIKEMNMKMKIPEKFEIEYNEKTVNIMALNAYKEGNPLYPVPKEFSLSDFVRVYQKILK